MNITTSDISLILRLILDVIVIWALVYYALRIVRNNTRTIQIAKGILFILIVQGLSAILGLNALNYLINIFVNWGVVVIVIIFQPEIRAMLEKFGKTSTILGLNVSHDEQINMIDELVKACEQMSKTKTGALISIQRSTSMEDYVHTGIEMDSVVSSELLGTIFQYGTPMHDGAVIIIGNKIACAAAYFPPTSKDLPSKYGARHRAAVGISEITDSITIIVSEETGNISVAMNGQLTQYKSEGLRRLLMNLLTPDMDEGATSSLLRPVINTAKNLGLTRSRKPGETRYSADERIQPLAIVDLRDQGVNSHE
ncbi:diadenylate cyclase CdaA [uncultured Faecalicoccus sp.]|uniref:diadenylate cyclase CdaA n=1 Tax=uncultured Faecalicoccus sp. TaxID=1971760 RepID=UPI0025DC726E|nr:diadenylate cyclase CdaA [uncultured Faecalicoccus sp.]